MCVCVCVYIYTGLNAEDNIWTRQEDGKRKKKKLHNEELQNL
jgi:hypothetical protein